MIKKYSAKLMGAGILPVSLHKNNLYFLFGLEENEKKWGDFGGSKEDNESKMETAVREGYEELNGFLGNKTDKKYYKSKIQEFIKNKGWTITIKSILENNEHSKKLEACRKIIVNSILENIRDSLEKLGIVFDNWFSESMLFEGNLVDKTIARLKETGKLSLIHI